MNIGADFGYFKTKIASGTIRTHFASLTGSVQKSRFGLDSDSTIILTQPAHVQVGEGAVEQSRFTTRREDRRWIESDTYHHLFLAALTECTSATWADIRLVTGLPVAFYDDRDELKTRLLGSHKVQREGRRAQSLNVTACNVIPQPFGSLLNEVLDDNGRIADTDLATGRVGVIDVGSKTTNILSTRNLREINEQSTSVSVGGWDLVRAVRDWLSKHCPDLNLRDHEINEAIIEREATYYGEPVSLHEVVNEELTHLSHEIIGTATQLWNGGANLHAILITGGGAMLLSDLIERRFPHARVVSGDPYFANAIGYWKFAQRLAG
jgi:plasmid segregation protein ParM